MSTIDQSCKPALDATAKFILHWIMLCVVIPAVNIFGGVLTNTTLILILPALVIMYCGTRLAGIAARGANRVVETMFWLYSYIFLGICAFLQIGAGHFPWPDHYADSLIVKAQLIVLAGLVAFDFGRRLTLGASPGGKLMTLRNFEISRQRLYIVSAVVLGVALYATIKMGAFSTLFLNRAMRSALMLSQYTIAQLTMYDALTKTVIYVLLIIALAYKLHKRRGGKLIIPVIAILAVATAVENNPIATARFQVGTIILSVFFVFPWRKYKASLAIYGMLLGLTIIFPYADLFRSSNSASLEARIERFRSENPLVVKVDYDSFQQVINGIRMVERDGLEYGQQLSAALFFWVPRSVWPDKAEPTGQLIAERSGYTFTNLSAPLWVEFYVDGGWLLILLGFAVYGRFVRKMDRARQNDAEELSPGYLIASIYAGYQIFLLRGSLLPAVAYLSPVIPVMLACSRWRIGGRVRRYLIPGRRVVS